VLQDDRIVFLANVWLDRPDTFEALHTLLSGEEELMGDGDAAAQHNRQQQQQQQASFSCSSHTGTGAAGMMRVFANCFRTFWRLQLLLHRACITANVPPLDIAFIADHLHLNLP
jgi:hypothetical protein